MFCRSVCTAIIALSIAAWAAPQNQPPPQLPQTTIRAEVALVNVIFSALDSKDRAVRGLQRGDFILLEDKQRQMIEYFSEADEGGAQPLTIALLLDTSGSVKDKLEYEKRTAAEFFRGVLRKDRDLALIIQFDSEVNLVQDFTNDVDRLIDAMDDLEAGNSTSLYDALFLAAEEKLKGEAGRRVIVVITDGEDTSSRISKDRAIESAQRNDVLVYGIGVRGDMGANFGVLKQLARETGGSFFSPHVDLEEIRAAFRAIGEDLDSQYSLAYRSSNPRRDGSFRSIELRCKVRGVRVRTRKGYFAPKG